MLVTYPLIYVILEKNGKILLIGYHPMTKRIIEAFGMKASPLYRDAMQVLSGFLTAGWKEIYRGGRWEAYEYVSTLYPMHRTKLPQEAEVD